MVAAVLVPATAASAAPPAPPTGLEVVDVGDVNPRFVWDSTSGATSYRITISPNSDFSGAIYNQTTPSTSFAPFDALPVGLLYWRVQVTNADGTSDWADAQYTHEQAEAPDLIAPAQGTTLDYPDDPPTFSWTEIPGSLSYILEIDDEDGFAPPTTRIVTPPGTTYTLPTSQDANKTYYWRVTGSSKPNGTGVLSTVSDTWSYNTTWTTRPQLVSPPDNTVSAITDIELKWTPVDGADRYQVQVNISDQFTGSNLIDETVYDTSYAPETTLDNGTYHWRVRPIDHSNRAGSWSETSPGNPFSFRRDWLPSPSDLLHEPATLPAPVPNPPAAFADPPRFEWTPVTLASHYEIQVGTNQAFSPGTFVSCFTNQTEAVPYTGGDDAPGNCSSNFWSRPYGIQQYWRVRAIDAPRDVLGFWSTVHTFTREPDQYPTMVSPANGATVGVPTFDWTPTTRSERYRIRVLDATGEEVIDETTYGSSFTALQELEAADGPFRWFVVTVGDDGQEALFPVPDSPAWRTFNLGAPPASAGSVTLLTPSDNAHTGEMPSMSWTPMTGADNYSVAYIREGTAVEFVLEDNLAYPAYTHLLPLQPGTYEWRVLAFSDDTQIGSSGYGTFTIDPLGVATLTGPPNCPPGQPGGCTPLTSSPMLTWNPVPYANFYLVYLAFDPEFTNIDRTYRVAYNRLIPREELPDNDAGQAYYWHVRPCVTQTDCGPDPQGTFAPSRAFQKRSSPVVLTAPAAGAAVTNEPRFSWQDYLASNPSDLGASRYRIQVSTSDTFATLLDDKRIDQTYFTPFDRTYPDGVLYWRVRPIDGSGNELTWTAPRSFTLQSPKPTLVQPTNNLAVPGQPTFIWQPMVGASRYEIEVYFDDPDKTFSPAKLAFREVTAFPVYAWDDQQLPVAESYSWRVRRLDGEDRRGSWSDGRNFSITAPAPALVTPNNGATIIDQSIVFDWNPAGNASLYRFQTSSVANFSTTRESRQTIMTTWSTTTTYTTGTWYWRVQALDAQGEVMATSTVRTFNRIAQPLPGAPTGLAVTNRPGGFTVSWNAPAQLGNPALTGYQIVVNQPDPLPDISRNVTASTTSTTFAGLTNGETYPVTVRAYAPQSPPPGTQYGPAALTEGDPNGCPNTPFSDVPANHPFCTEIEWMVSEGITQGSAGAGGNIYFNPTQAVSRGSMAAFLFRFDGEGDPSLSPNYFADVTSGVFFEPIQWMWEEDLSLGTPNPPGKPNYRPGDPVSRQSMAAFLNRYDNLGIFPSLSPSEFADVNNTSVFYSNVQWMAQSELSLGYTNPAGGKPLYKPLDAVSRQTMAAFLYRFNGEINS
jgi:hypothetical protein